MIQAMKTPSQIQKKYFRRARLVSLILQLAPFVRMVGLTGSLAQNKATQESDIDFFIVTKPRHIWTGRALATLFIHLTGLRRYGQKQAGRICLNCYQTEDHLEIHPSNQKNALDYSKMIPLWQSNNLYEKFCEANGWMKRYGIVFKKYPGKNRALFLIIQFLLESIIDLFLGDWGENFARHYQAQRILKDPRTQKSPAGAIFVSDKEIRFHPTKDLTQNNNLLK